MNARRLCGLALVVMTLLTGCAMPPQAYQPIQTTYQDFSITFTFEAYDALTNRSVTVPLTLTTTVPGWAADITQVPSTPAGLTVKGSTRPQAEHDVIMSGTVTADGKVSTVLVCSWTAHTIAGTRTSERSRGGEDEGTGPTATATCTYKA